MNIHVDVITSRFAFDIIFHVDLRMTFCKRIMPGMILTKQKAEGIHEGLKANKKKADHKERAAISHIKPNHISSRGVRRMKLCT
jgi:hypothetical protein